MVSSERRGLLDTSHGSREQKRQFQLTLGSNLSEKAVRKRPRAPVQHISGLVCGSRLSRNTYRFNHRTKIAENGSEIGTETAFVGNCNIRVWSGLSPSAWRHLDL